MTARSRAPLRRVRRENEHVVHVAFDYLRLDDWAILCGGKLRANYVVVSRRALVTCLYCTVLEVPP